MNYLAGRSNLACTIFVPYDCNNHCPFCTSKLMYRDIQFNLEKVLERIKLVNACNAVTEYVITGGEPIANLDILKQIVSVCTKKVYINTTLPNQKDLNQVIRYINYENKIKGVSISRHMDFKFPNVADKDTIRTIKKPVRINTVISDIQKIESFINEWMDYGLINLREDYRKIDTTTLKSWTEVSKLLMSRYTYRGTNSCLVCNSEFFGDENYLICYHRGLEKSAIELDNKIYINDIIIHPDGNIYYDWDKKTSDDFINALNDNIK